MIKRQYVVDYEVVVSGKVTKWGTQCFHTRSWFPVAVGDLADEIRADAAEYSGCEPGEIRIKAVFKL